MEYLLSDSQKTLLSSLTTFLRKNEVEKNYQLFEQDKERLNNLFLRFAAEGFLGVPFDTPYGGSGGGTMEAVIIMEELSRSLFPLALQVSTSWMFGGNIISVVGNNDQKEKFIPKIISGQLRTSMALTEPEAGSDAASIKTTARKEGNHFIISGQKTFISGADKADIIIIAARTNENVPKQKGISLIIVNSDAPGIEMVKLEALGRKTLSTFHIFFDNVKIPEENLLGDLNKGWDNLSKILSRERIMSAAMSTGGSQAVLETLVKFVRERNISGVSLSKLQAIRHKMADIYIGIMAARLLTYNAAHELDCDVSPDLATSPSVAKVFAGENWIRSAQEGMEIMGSFGYLPEYNMRRYFCDSRLVTIAGGTAEIQRNLIAKGLRL